MTEIDKIPIEELYAHPIVKELLDQINTDLEKEVKLPYVIKDKTLMSPGIWNNYFYSSDSIKDAFLKTEWNKKENRSLFLDHQDLKSSEWIGEINNPRLIGEDLIGDLVVLDKPTAMKLHYGAKMGISPKVSGEEEGGSMVNFRFDNFSVVINPAVKTAYINNMEEVDLMNTEKTEDLQTGSPVEEAKKKYPTEPFTKPGEGVQQSEMSTETILSAIVEDAKLSEWTDKIKEYIKAHPGSSVQDAIKEIKKASSEMAEKTVAQQLSEILEILKEKYPYPKEEKAEEKPKEKYPYPATHMEQENAKIQEMSQQITELNTKLATVTAKLNEPDRVTTKSAELSIQSEDSDVGMLNLFKEIGGAL